MKDKIRSFALLAVALMLVVGMQAQVVMAQNELVIPKGEFSIVDWLRHNFNFQVFSVVGDAQGCGIGGEPDSTLAIGGGDLFDFDAADFCSSGHGMWLTYKSDSWDPFMEFPDILENIQCNPASTQCNFEIYCCDYQECSSDSQCEDRVEEGSECIDVQCNDWPNVPGYQCEGLGGVVEDRIPYSEPSYSYCSAPTTECFYYNDLECVNRFYVDPECPFSFEGRKLYDLFSECEDNIPSQPTCSDGTQNQGETGVDCGGPCSACSDGGNGNGGDGGGDGGDGVGKEDIRAIGQVYKSGGLEFDLDLDNVIAIGNLFSLQDEGEFHLTLKNFGDTGGTINVEAGFYSNNYADNVAELFSVFELFATVSPEPNCNPSEDFVQTKSVTLSPNEEVTVVLEVKPKNALKTFPSAGTYDLENNKLIAFWGLYEECLGGYINDAETTGRGVMFDWFETEVSCSLVFPDKIFCGTGQVGSCRSHTLTLDSTCSIPSTVSIVEGTADSTDINVDSGSPDTTYIDLKKASLTETQIEEATTGDLLASACLSNNECLSGLDEDGEEIDSSCVKLNKLKEEGILTQADTDEFFSDAKSTIGLAAVGGAVGLALCAAPAIPTAGLSLVACTGVGALAVAGLSILGQDKLADLKTSIANIFSNEDELTKAINAGESNTVGICTVRESFDLGSLIESLGESISITGKPFQDGLIIIFGGLLIVFFLFRAGGRKK